MATMGGHFYFVHIRHFAVVKNGTIGHCSTGLFPKRKRAYSRTNHHVSTLVEEDLFQLLVNNPAFVGTGPGQYVLTFLLVEEDLFQLLVNNPAFVGTGPGQYVLCESLEEPLADPKVGNHIVVRGTKKLNKCQEIQRHREGRDSANPNLNLISVKSIYEPILALADIRAPEGTFLFVHPVDDWGYLFSDIIEELAVGSSVLSNEENEEEDNSDKEELDSHLEESGLSDGTSK
jgi:hypothetical protein